ncbi:EAL domain-containing protein [Luteimonas pelagia]
MQFGKDMVLRLLIVDDSAEAAEAIVSSLRNGGIAVRPSRPEAAADLAAAVTGQPLDLVLVARDAKAVPLDQVMQCVDVSGKDLPVLVAVDTLDEHMLLQAVDAGARGVVLRGRPDHLLSAVRSEWTDLEARRALRRLEAQVRETERRCDALIESSRDPIAYVHEGMHIRANAAYLEMFGFEGFDDIEGMSLLDLVAPAHVAEFKTLLKSLSKGEPPPSHYELQARDLEGNDFPAVMEFTTATYEGEQCIQVVFRRQEEVDPELAREVEALRQRDQVTGLFNRPTFLRNLEDAVAGAAKSGTSHALLLIEPDHSAQLLQDIGLDAADTLMATLADRLRGALPEGAVAARFGENQFAVLVMGSDHVQTAKLAERVRAAFADHVIEVGDRSLNATVSIGGVQVGEKIASVTQVLAKASQGVQSAIGVGGNRAEIFDPGAVDRAEEERIRAWVERVRDAIDKDNFELHYQPVVSLHGEPGELYEGFLRMRTGPGELVPPLSFLHIAEEHGLLWEIDRWVVSNAIRVIGERLQSGHETTLLVKITQASLQDDSLVQYIREKLARHGVPGNLLVLEIPEAKVFTHLRAAQAFQTAIAEMGCRMCLEQFGSGLNSFQLLTHFDAALLKIDRGFMQDLSANTDNQERVREIATRAREAGKLTIAEFVQDATSMSLLFGAGVDYVQGHFLAPAESEMTYDFE